MKPRLDINIFRLIGRKPGYTPKAKPPTTPGYKFPAETVGLVLKAIRCTTSISRQSLIKKVSLSETTVQAIVNELESQGLVKKKIKQYSKIKSLILTAVRTKDFKPVRAKPKDSTLKLVLTTIKRHKEICKLSLSKKTGFQKNTINSCIELLIDQGRIAKKFLRHYGGHDMYTYSAIKGVDNE